jgi:hypothetical protein
LNRKKFNERGKWGGQIRKMIVNHNRIILTQLILRIENTKAGHDRIKNRINISYPSGASNERY